MKIGFLGLGKMGTPMAMHLIAAGHSGGIYSWEYLRRVCQCQECSFSRDETMGTPN